MKWYKYDTGFPVIDMKIYSYEIQKFYNNKRPNLIEADFHQWDAGFEYEVWVDKGRKGYGADVFSVGLVVGAMCYKPEANLVWVYDFYYGDGGGIDCRFIVKNWKEVEKLRWQINRAYYEKDKK